MATTNSIKALGINATYTINNFVYTADYSENSTPIGTSSFAGTVTIQTGSWQPLYNSGSAPQVSDVGLVYIDNPFGPGTVQFATGSSGGYVLATQQSGDWSKISWTGSFALYAKALDVATPVNIVVIPN